MPSQSTLWIRKNAKFEKFLLEDPTKFQFCAKMFRVQDDNHHLQAWWPYIDLNHPNEEDWHILVDAFVMDTTNGLVELLTTITNINKQDFNPTTQFCLHDNQNVSSFCCISNNQVSCFQVH